MRRHAKVLVVLGALLAFYLLAVSPAGAAAPAVTIEPAGEITLDSAKAEGTVDPEGKETSYYFQHATQAQAEAGQWEGFDGFETLSAGAGATTVSAQIGGLSPATTYRLRLVASNEDGEERTVSASFETDVPTPPALATEAVDGIGYTRATLHGTVDPEGGNLDPVSSEPLPLEWQLQYSPANQLGEPEGWNFAGGATIEGAAAEGTTPIGVSAELAAGALQPGREYLTRLVAYYAIPFYLEASSPEPFESFETNAATAPTAGEPSVTALTGPGAHLSATVNPDAPASEAALAGDEDSQAAFRTSWHFECEPECPGLQGEVPAGDEARTVQADATGLEPNTEYTVKLVATNGGGGDVGATASFETPAAPTPLILAPSGITTGGATLHGTVDAHGLAGTWAFQVTSPTSAYQGATPSLSIPAGTGAVPVSAAIADLPAGQTFQVNLVVMTTAGTTRSATLSFQTGASPTESAPGAGPPALQTFVCANPARSLESGCAPAAGKHKPKKHRKRHHRAKHRKHERHAKHDRGDNR